MEYLQRFFLYLSLIALFCLMMGLFKPWIMLWWEHTQNRKKVIRIYGSATIIGFVLYWLTLIV